MVARKGLSGEVLLEQRLSEAKQEHLGIWRGVQLEGMTSAKAQRQPCVWAVRLGWT